MRVVPRDYDLPVDLELLFKNLYSHVLYICYMNWKDFLKTWISELYVVMVDFGHF